MIQGTPTPEQLKAYLLGNVTAHEQAEISAYLELHPELTAGLIEADAASDSLLDDLRQPAGRGGGRVPHAVGPACPGAHRAAGEAAGRDGVRVWVEGA